MKVFLIALALVVVAVVAVVAAAYFVLPTYSWHQKMTITVEADGKTYSGSSVVRVRFSKNDPLSAANGPEWIATVRGEAPFVEIPGRGVLFALLDPPGTYTYSTDLIFEAFSQVLPDGSFEEKLRYLESDPGESVVLPAKLYPFFLTFSNTKDPRSVREVDPNSLATYFGSGVRLKGVALSITSEPVSSGSLDDFGFMNVLLIQSTLSGLQAYDARYSDPVYYVTRDFFRRGR